MKKGGTGGVTTITGLKFERDTDLATALSKLPGYNISKNMVFYKGKQIAQICSKYKLYTDFLNPQKVDWKEIISKRLLPDEAIYVTETKTMYIVEKKYQECEGSVDEKLQTCDFKKKTYTKLLKPLGLDVKVIYVLNDWFKQDKYRDSLNYIKQTGCHYFFNEFPIKKLDLPDSEIDSASE